jgi:hypothetical protein
MLWKQQKKGYTIKLNNTNWAANLSLVHTHTTQTNQYIHIPHTQHLPFFFGLYTLFELTELEFFFWNAQWVKKLLPTSSHHLKVMRYDFRLGNTPDWTKNQSASAVHHGGGNLFRRGVTVSRYYASRQRSRTRRSTPTVIWIFSSRSQKIYQLLGYMPGRRQPHGSANIAVCMRQSPQHTSK